MADTLTVEERERQPIYHGSQERKQAVLRQFVESARKYAKMSGFLRIEDELQGLLLKYF